MRALLLPALALGLLGGAVSRSLAQEDTRAIIDRALKAHGGADKLAKVKASQYKSKGVIHILNQAIKFTSDSSVQDPDQFKSVTQLEIAGMKITQIQILNGDKGFVSVNGMPQDLSDKLLNEMKEGLYAERVAGLTPLKEKEKDYQLSALGSVQVEGKDAVGVRVASKGHRDVNLYFDKASGLLVKVAHRTLDPMTNQEVSQEEIRMDYRDYEGIKLPAKLVVLRDGKKFMEAEVSDFKIVDKLDPSVFAKP